MTILLLSFAFKFRSRERLLWGLMIALLSIYVFGAGFRFFALNQDILRDLVELGRFLPIFGLFLTVKFWDKLTPSDFLQVLTIFISINLLVCLSQVAGSNFSIVSFLYNSDLHERLSLGVSSRALGLAPGPGQNASICFAIFSVMLSFLALTVGVGWQAFYGLIAAFLCILLSQSQTVFIAAAVTTFVAIGVFSVKLKGGRGWLARLVGIVLLVSAGSITYLLRAKFAYLATLFSQGLNRSSFLKREEKWQFFIDQAFNEPFQIIFGWGKSFFGPGSGAMDNEWLYLFLVYGAPMFLFIVSACGVFILKYFFNKVISAKPLEASEFGLWLICLGGTIIGMASAFFTQMNVLILVFVLWRVSLNQHRVAGDGR